jgi:hypothetical protein
LEQDVRTVIIVGLGGCGTRFISKALHDAGIPMWVRETGCNHWEDYPLLDINEEALRRKGNNWKTTNSDPVDSSWLMGKLEMYRAMRESEKRVPYGMKDPRISLMLPCYKKVFEDVKWICCIRNPMSMAMSHIRNGRFKTVTKALHAAAHKMTQITTHVHPFWFCYGCDIQKQQHDLSSFVGRKIDLASEWGPKH